MAKDDAPIGRRKFLKSASLAGVGVLSTRMAKAEEPAPTPEPIPNPETGAPPLFSPDTPVSSLVNPAKPMPTDVTAEQIRKALQLEPNQTCGFVRNTYKSALTIAPGGLPAPFEAGRPAGTALFFMVTPEAPVKLHRIKNDQLYHYYQGDPLEVLLLYESGTSELVVVGPNVIGGQLVQLFIPASPDTVAGSWADRPSGPASMSRAMSSLATPRRWRRNILKPPQTSAPSPSRRNPRLPRSPSQSPCHAPSLSKRELPTRPLDPRTRRTSPGTIAATPGLNPRGIGARPPGDSPVSQRSGALEVQKESKTGKGLSSGSPA